jgi:hypothetical protein
MKALLLVAALVSGCSTVVPVTQTWPKPPGQLSTEPCTPLQKLPEAPQLSDVAKTIVNNYTQYYECATKLEAWQDWYAQQKIIYESLK